MTSLPSLRNNLTIKGILKVLYRWIKQFRNALKEKIDLVEELKEIVNENKESNYEFTSIISHQRQDIESLRKLLEDNNIEVGYWYESYDMIHMIWLNPNDYSFIEIEKDCFDADIETDSLESDSCRRRYSFDSLDEVLHDIILTNKQSSLDVVNHYHHMLIKPTISL